LAPFEEISLHAVLTDADCDLLVCARIHPNSRHIEPALNATRWFDLRRLHPAELTNRFVEAYDVSVREHHAATRDLDEAAALQVRKGEPDLWKRPDLIAYWRPGKPSMRSACRMTGAAVRR
jgi:hypothetical protein